jgi:succinyl-diaminopimelate desuccinylase
LGKGLHIVDIVERLLTLVKIDSVIGDEKTICDTLLNEFAAKPYGVQRVGDSFALYPQQRSEKKLVVLVGHLDTVPPSADNIPRIEGDRLFGLGSADMKSGLAIMWQLIEEPEPSAEYDLAFIFYHGEEGPYADSGLGPLLEAIDWLDEVALAICLEPSDNRLQLGCLGTLHAEVTFAGRAAHSARPWQGENAIHKAAGLLQRLKQVESREVKFGDLIYREVISATLAQGGTARNVVPDRFILNLNFRFAPDRNLEHAQKFVKDLVAGEAEITFTDLAPSGAIPQDNDALEALRAVCTEPPQSKQAWTDVARLSAAGVPAVNLGPGAGAEAHQPNESTSIATLRQGEALFRSFLRAL